MIRPSDKGPGRPRPPRVKTPRPPSGGSGGGTKKTGCWRVAVLPIAVPALAVLAACTAMHHT